jgi:hypothetical protein
VLWVLKIASLEAKKFGCIPVCVIQGPNIRRLASKPAFAVLILCERAEPDGLGAEFSALKHNE